MFFGYFVRAVGELLHSIFMLYIFMMVARAILSWVNPDPNNPIVRFLIGSTDPLLVWVRRWLPPIGGIDLSVLVVIFALYFLDRAVSDPLVDYGRFWIHSVRGTM